MSQSASPARLVTAVSNAGIAVRYAFYTVGALVFTVAGIGMLMIWNNRVRISDEKPAFHLAAPQLSQLPMTSKIVTGGRYGRVEMVHYGQLHDRNIDMAVAVTMPPANVWRDNATDLPGIRPAKLRYSQTSTYHDLETRFGAMRAREIRVEADGQWKQCLTYISRFHTEAVHITGWLCDPSGAKPSPDRLACTLDRLVLDGQLASKEADKFLRERMARSPSCSSAPVAQSIDTRQRTSSPQRRFN
jgi:hypothetical protein